MVSHKKYFSYCKFAQGKQTYNIPYADNTACDKTLDRPGGPSVHYTEYAYYKYCRDLGYFNTFPTKIYKARNYIIDLNMLLNLVHKHEDDLVM